MRSWLRLRRVSQSVAQLGRQLELEMVLEPSLRKSLRPHIACLVELFELPAQPVELRYEQDACLPVKVLLALSPALVALEYQAAFDQLVMVQRQSPARLQAMKVSVANLMRPKQPMAWWIALPCWQLQALVVTAQWLLL